ncbi:MAG: hypothetical protein LBR83_10830 [Clostridiales bacterium]|jgi:hypothetical protein|nr:hypothetical protein [Clostridiales bacterium]
MTNGDNAHIAETENAPAEMTRGEYRRFMVTATLTALGVGLIFSAVLVLFVLFCIFVWLK